VACVGEQLAFHALLDFAQATPRDRGVAADFGPLWDLAYDDHGVRTLFEVSHPVDPRLKFHQWFHPFADEDVVHPSIRFRDQVHTRIS